MRTTSPGPHGTLECRADGMVVAHPLLLPTLHFYFYLFHPPPAVAYTDAVKLKEHFYTNHLLCLSLKKTWVQKEV